MEKMDVKSGWTNLPPKLQSRAHRPFSHIRPQPKCGYFHPNFQAKMSISIPIGYSPKSSANSKLSQSFQSTSTNPPKFDFAQQLHFKLSKLAEKRQIMSKRDWPNERQATLDELDDEAEDGDISRTPERMCEWMRVQSNRPQFDGLFPNGK